MIILHFLLFLIVFSIGYLMKKTGFGWTKCWVSVQIQQKKPGSNESAIMLTWQPTTAKPSKVCIIFIYISL